MKETYPIARTCMSCGHEEKITASKREAAFDLIKLDQTLGPTCSMCNGKSFSGYGEKPSMDYELFQEWATNPSLYYTQQDEDLMLADERYLDFILEFIDADSTHQYKRDAMFSTLCVLVYDNSDDIRSDKKLKNRVIDELENRLAVLLKSDESILNYIKEVVYPQLDWKSYYKKPTDSNVKQKQDELNESEL